MIIKQNAFVKLFYTKKFSPENNIKCDLDYFCSLMTDSQKIFMHNFFKSSQRHNGLMYMSQATLGAWAGVSREWANKMIKQLVAWGWISKLRRYNTSCLYRVSDWLYKPEVCKILAHHFSCFIGHLNPDILVPLMKAPIATIEGVVHIIYFNRKINSNERANFNYWSSLLVEVTNRNQTEFEKYRSFSSVETIFGRPKETLKVDCLRVAIPGDEFF